MTASRSVWERISDGMTEWCGYALLIAATILGLLGGDPDLTWRATTIAIAIAAAAWIYLLYTRLPRPKKDHRLQLYVFFVGLLVFASVLMLREPIFFVFMIAGFFYASQLRPMPLAIVGVGATSILVNTLVAGLPTSTAAWTFYIAIIVVQTVVIGGGVMVGEKVAERNEERRVALERLEVALKENAGLHVQLVAQAREAGILDERARMAREIHDTIAQGLIGIVTQLEAADQAADRPIDRDRHLANAKQLARDSLVEARRSVKGSVPVALESSMFRDAVGDIAQAWSTFNGVPVEVTVTGEPMTLASEIEVALLRTEQEALANVARHARATRVALTLSFMGDVVTLDVRDDGVGFEPTRLPPADADLGGFGLAGMRQRLATVAGSLAVELEPGGGTALSARVPAIPAP